jgi:sugar lactone lactonase YvrE
MFRALLVGLVAVLLAIPGQRVVDPPSPLPYRRTLHFSRLVDTFSRPHRLTSDADGNIYISDLVDRKVYMYDRKFAYQRAFGTGNNGDDVGDLASPAGVAILNGYLFVADTGNNRISYFALYGSTVGYVLDNGVVNRPVGLATTPDGNLIVVSRGDARVIKFSTTGSIQFMIDNQLSDPSSVAVDTRNYVYVTDPGSRRVVKFDPAGQFVRHIGGDLLQKPEGIAVDRAGSVIVTDRAREAIYRFDWRGVLIGEYIERLNPQSPIDVSVLNARNLPPYVLVSNARGEVNAYENVAQPARHSEQARFKAGEAIKGMVFDRGGNLFVTEGRRVLRFDRFGTLLQEWAYKFDAPSGIAANHIGKVYVIDGGQIKVFDSEGGFVRAWDGAAVGGFAQLARIAVDDSSFVYLTDSARSRVYKYTIQGEFMRAWEARSPVGVAVDMDTGTVFVNESSAANSQIVRALRDDIKLFNGYGELTGAFGIDFPKSVDMIFDGRGTLYAAAGTSLLPFYRTGTAGDQFPVNVPITALAYDSTSGQLYSADAAGMITRWGAVNRQPQTPGVWRPSTQIFILKSGEQGISNLESHVIDANETDLPLAGDWNGDGIDTVGLYRPGTGFFYLWDSVIGLEMDNAHTVALLGNPGDLPLAGDWNGDGIDGIGTFRRSNGLIYLQNMPGARTPDFTMVFGSPDDIGIAGDWNGDGQDTTGTYRPSEFRFYLSDRNANGSLSPEYSIDLGNPGDLPFAGDWTGYGADGVGIFRPSTGYFYLRETFDKSQPDRAWSFGRAGDLPLSGAWGALPVPDLPPLNAPQPTTPPLVVINTPTRTPTGTPVFAMPVQSARR